MTKKHEIVEPVNPETPEETVFPVNDFSAAEVDAGIVRPFEPAERQFSDIESEIVGEPWSLPAEVIVEGRHVTVESIPEKFRTDRETFENYLNGVHVGITNPSSSPVIDHPKPDGYSNDLWEAYVAGARFGQQLAKSI